MAQAAIKRHLKSIVIRAGLESFHLAERAGINEEARGRGLILTLHQVKPHVAASFAPNAGLIVTPEFLDAAIVTLKASGYTPVALEELPARIAAAPDGEERFVAFTADDGYRNNRDHALPVLQRHSVPLTVFITEGFVKRTHSMWWETAERLIAASSGFTFDFGKGEEQVRADTHGAKMRAFERLAVSIRSRRQDHFIAALDAASRAAGIDPLAIVAEETMDAAELKEFESDPLISFGAHTVSHPSLAHVDEARLADELSRSADYVESLTGKRPATLAYPYGDGHAATPREYKAAERAGFSLAVTTNAGVLTREAIAATPTALPRVSLNGHYQKPRYVRALASGLAFHFT
jgi:peptidoglycan/xylan/chitin deacetylase (PgdA/CDA1 family)